MTAEVRVRKPRASYLTLIILAAALLTSAIVMPAGALPRQAVSTKDESCYQPHDCIQRDECTRVEFTAKATTTFRLSASVRCTGDDKCSDCNSCVNLYEIDPITGNETFFANSHTTNCASGQCDYTVDVNLTGGQEYAMYVCLLHCNGGEHEDCRYCQDCLARGCVYIPGTPCPSP